MDDLDLSLDWRRLVNVGRSQAEFISLPGEIDSMEIDDDDDGDSCIWCMSHDVSFSVSNVKKHIDDCMLPNMFPCTQRYNVIPRKVNNFMCRLFLGRLPHCFKLSSRGLDIELIMCLLCNVHVESNAHDFFSCDTASNVWSLVCAWSDFKDLDFELL
ncbi:RNA-directed DNA polymerase, eukaryota [Tanacetum coccineum]